MAKDASPSTVRRKLDFAKLAMMLMEKHNINPDPANYRIWYTYAAVTNDSLNNTINILISNKHEFSHSVCEDLYYQFFQSQDETEQLSTVTEKIESQLSALVSDLTKAGIDTSHYGQALEGAARTLQTYPQAESGLRFVINLLMDATRQMEKHNQNLQTHLQHSGQRATELHTAIEKIRTVSVTDPLTEIGNRRSFDEHLREYAMHSMESGGQLCLVFLDVDKFKQVNDIWGHILGDQVLRLIASIMSSIVGERGFCARYGGEEFTILLPDMDIRAAEQLANEIREAVCAREIINRENGQSAGTVTISAGAAVFAFGEPLTSFVARADAALYAAKQNGRNCVVCETALPPQGAEPAPVSQTPKNAGNAAESVQRKNEKRLAGYASY